MTMRHPDPERRAEILARAAAYVLEHGLSDLSLRPLAAALNTSGRMLIYYFGTKDQLVVDVLDEIRRRKYAELGLGAEDVDVLRRYWDWATSPEGQRYLRLVYEVYGLSLHEPERFSGFLTAESRDVVENIGHGFRAAGIPDHHVDALSTYTFAALRGLELDLLATGEANRIGQAFDMFEADLQRRAEQLTAPVPRGRKKERRP